MCMFEWSNKLTFGDLWRKRRKGAFARLAATASRKKWKSEKIENIWIFLHFFEWTRGRLPRATRSRPKLGKFSFFSKILTWGRRKLTYVPLATVSRPFRRKWGFARLAAAASRKNEKNKISNAQKLENDNLAKIWGTDLRRPQVKKNEKSENVPADPTCGGRKSKQNQIFKK